VKHAAHFPFTQKGICSFGFDVGRNVTQTLIERGFDARSLRGGLAAWYVSGGARALNPTAG
jgi:hypothetical protein